VIRKASNKTNFCGLVWKNDKPLPNGELNKLLAFIFTHRYNSNVGYLTDTRTGVDRMNGESRAGREKQFLKILKQQAARKSDRWMTTGMVCNRAGLKSSTRFKNMLFDMALRIDGVMWREDRGKREYAWVKPTQMTLPERYITINGKSHHVANWVLGSQEAWK